MSHRKDERLIKSARRKAGQKNTIPEGQSFVWFTRAMLESESFKALSGNAFKVLSRLLLEQIAHAGTSNGELICTYEDLYKYGVRRASIGQAIQQLDYMGFIRIDKGIAYKGEHTPSKYRLTFYPASDGRIASNEWSSINAAHVKAYDAKLKRDQDDRKEATKRRKVIRAEEEKRLAELNTNVIPLIGSKGGQHA